MARSKQATHFDPKFSTSFWGEGGLEYNERIHIHFFTSTPSIEGLCVALKLLRAVREARITDRDSRDHALRAAKGACRNIAEATGRVSAGDKARVFGIARGETIEAVCTVEIAVESGAGSRQALRRVLEHGNALYAMLTALSRRR